MYYLEQGNTWYYYLGFSQSIIKCGRWANKFLLVFFYISMKSGQFDITYKLLKSLNKLGDRLFISFSSTCHKANEDD